MIDNEPTLHIIFELTTYIKLFIKVDILNWARRLNAQSVAQETVGPIASLTCVVMFRYCLVTSLTGTENGKLLTSKLVNLNNLMI